ncbi:hypothetical protein LZ554_001741 [Drepanopeziza brunnea f. sp. 'monogermtubi']|nr:hypothetical protein LZ554_001741 [Drepanopeziza brunnea f. sp. 'monogermtubi']
MNVASSIVRRGLEAHATHGEDVQKNLPVWGVLMLAATAVVYVVAMFTIEYTFGRLIPTLLMIEAPADDISFNSLATEDPDSIIKDPEPVSTKPQFITSSFRRTIRHLGGFNERFRGVWIFIVHNFLVQWIAGMLAALPIIRFVPRGFLTVGATVALAQLSLGWTHIVITPASLKTWFRRVPPMSMWKKVAIPTAVFALAEQLAVWIPLYLAVLAGIVDNTPDNMDKMTPHQQTVMGLKAIGIAVLSLVLGFLVVIPANVALTRVQASLLDDAEETIVPFDRSFGGKVVPEIVGGSGVIGMLEAWKSFDWDSRIRLIKAYCKVFAMQMAVTLMFTVLLVSQLFIIVGKDWSKFVPQDGNKGN